MLKEPTPQEVVRARARGEIAPAQVIVATTSSERLMKPEHDQDAFADAARAALIEVIDTGYSLLQFSTVTEFVLAHNDDMTHIIYRYVWEFNAVRTESE